MIIRFGSLAVLFSICLTFGACSYTPSSEVLAAADYGIPMTASEMQVSADKYMVRVLKDPDSRRIEWGQSGKAWIWAGAIGGGYRYGYGLEGFVNAKNSFGGYTGSKPYFFFFRNGALVGAEEIYSRDMHGFVP